ncbi:MAG TPA: LPS assembly protein LptD [Thermoanaerobaculia bacterium]|nr:LPS assembly protein LptD [Thermoanaerobaculia bacterium]
MKSFRPPIFLALLCLASPLLAQSGRFSFEFKLPEKGGSVRIRADNQEFVRGEYAILTGNVTIAYGDVTIRADKVTWNEKTSDVVAEGNVIIDQGTRRLTARRMIYNLQTETGTFFEATGAFEPSIYFRGESIEKISEDTYRLSNGVFTSCDIDDPDWSFLVGRGVVTVDDYARLRNVSFRAGRLPMFWTPWLVWPTKEERARGFLTPSVGFRSRLGSYFGASYFIPIGDSADLTLLGDVHTEGYYGLGTEARYVPSQNVTGKLTGYAVTDPEFDGEIEWRYAWTHNQDGLPGGFRGVIDIRDFSDLDFFRFYERDFETSTISNVYSSAYLTKSRPSYALNIRADRREQFLSAGRSETFEQLPAIQFSTYPKRLGSTPLYFSLESSSSHLRTSFGADYYRADVFPTLSLQVRTPSWISVKPQVSLRETWYTASRDPLTRAIEDESLSRFYAQGQVELTGPSVSRIFNREMAGFSRFKHVIEPRIRYLYTSDVEDQDRVIRFDTVDSPYLPLVRETVELGLVNRVIAKEKGESGNAREVMSVSLRQSISLADPYTQFVGGQRVETDATPVTLNLRINPYQAIALDANVVWGNLTEQIDQVNLSTNLAGGGGTRFLNFTWFSRFREPGATSGESSQFRVTTGLPLWRDRLRIDAAVNYDATREEFLEQRYFTRFNASCYNIGLEFRDFIEYRTGTPRRNRDYRLSIDLKNVGSFPINLPGSLGNIFDF